MSQQSMEILDVIAGDLRNGKSVIFWAKGYSMTPMIRDGVDKIRVVPLGVAQPLEVGMLVFGTTPAHGYLLHRIIALKEPHQVLLRGDGNPRGVELCQRDELFGEAVGVIRPSGREVRKGSLLWKCYQHLWPRQILLRRVLLALLRVVGYYSR